MPAMCNRTMRHAKCSSYAAIVKCSTSTMPMNYSTDWSRTKFFWKIVIHLTRSGSLCVILLSLDNLSSHDCPRWRWIFTWSDREWNSYWSKVTIYFEHFGRMGSRSAWQQKTTWSYLKTNVLSCWRSPTRAGVAYSKFKPCMALENLRITYRRFSWVNLDSNSRNPEALFQPPPFSHMSRDNAITTQRLHINGYVATW